MQIYIDLGRVDFILYLMQFLWIYYQTNEIRIFKTKIKFNSNFGIQINAALPVARVQLIDLGASTSA